MARNAARYCRSDAAWMPGLVPRPSGMVPAGNRVATLLAGVDTQDDGFFVSIWAIGWGHAREMWLEHFIEKANCPVCNSPQQQT